VVRAPASVSGPTWLLVILSRHVLCSSVDLPKDGRGPDAQLLTWNTSNELTQQLRDRGRPLE
jgi:hypothetical protein